MKLALGAAVTLLTASCSQPAAPSPSEPAVFPLGQRTLPFTRWPEGEGPGAPQEVWSGGVLASRRWFEAGVQIEERFFEGRLCQRKRRDLPPPPGLRWREVQELPPLVPSDPLRRFITTEDERGRKTLVEEVDAFHRGEWRKVVGTSGPPLVCGDSTDPFR